MGIPDITTARRFGNSYLRCRISALDVRLTHRRGFLPSAGSPFSALDEELGHCRRYRRAELEERLQQAGYEVESTSCANAVGAFGWWLNGRILRRRHIPGFQAKLNNLLVPLLRLERALGVPFGLSLVVVARRVARQEDRE